MRNFGKLERGDGGSEVPGFNEWVSEVLSGGGKELVLSSKMSKEELKHIRSFVANVKSIAEMKRIEREMREAGFEVKRVENGDEIQLVLTFS